MCRPTRFVRAVLLDPRLSSSAMPVEMPGAHLLSSGPRSQEGLLTLHCERASSSIVLAAGSALEASWLAFKARVGVMNEAGVYVQCLSESMPCCTDTAALPLRTLRQPNTMFGLGVGSECRIRKEGSDDASKSPINNPQTLHNEELWPAHSRSQRSETHPETNDSQVVDEHFSHHG